MESFLQTGVAVNHGGEAGAVAIGTAANVAPISDTPDGWDMISPYGEFPNPLGLQVVNQEYCQRMVTAFNSVFAKLGRTFRGLPVFRGHPDVMPQRWPDDKRYGRYVALEARADAFYGKPAWNAAGRENVEEGYYVYPSPAWEIEELGNGRIAPVRLKSVGLTNTPNIASAVPVTNSREQHADTIMIKQIAEKFGLNADAPVEQILAAINALQQKADGNLTALNVAAAAKTEAETKLTAANSAKSLLETQLSAASAKVDAAQAEATKYRTQARDLLTTAAINEGRLPAAEVTAANAEFDADFDKGAAALAKRTKAMNTAALDLQRTAAGDLSTPEARRLAFNARVDELTAPAAQGGKGMSVTTAMNLISASTTPQDKALMEAMNKAEAAA